MRLSDRFSLLDQQTCPLRCRDGFRRGIAFHWIEWRYERDLKLNFFATQRGSNGQRRYLVEGTCELASLQRAPNFKRPLSRFAPQSRSLLDQTCLGAVTRQQLWLVLGNLGELAFKGFSNACVKRASRLAKQRAIGCILHKCMLEQVGRLRRHTCRNSKPAA